MSDALDNLNLSIKDIGRQLRDARTELDLSQTELARRIGVRQPIISRIENGTHVLTWRNLVRICDALNMDVRIILQPRD